MIGHVAVVVVVVVSLLSPLEEESAAGEEDTVVTRLNEAMLVISSVLLRTFLSGNVGATVNASSKTDKVDFPNDPSDVTYDLESSGSMSTFRLQIAL